MCVSQDGSELRDGVLAKLAALTVLLRLPNLGFSSLRSDTNYSACLNLTIFLEFLLFFFFSATLLNE